MSQDSGENTRVIFNESFIYVCRFCGKLSNDVDDLTDHLDDDHEDEYYDDIDLDGPLFKTRKLKYYHKQVNLIKSLIIKQVKKLTSHKTV